MLLLVFAIIAYCLIFFFVGAVACGVNAICCGLPVGVDDWGWCSCKVLFAVVGVVRSLLCAVC